MCAKCQGGGPGDCTKALTPPTSVTRVIAACAPSSSHSVRKAIGVSYKHLACAAPLTTQAGNQSAGGIANLTPSAGPQASISPPILAVHRLILIARIRITLNDVDPRPMRQIEVPLKIRLDELHEVVQAAMGWTDTPLYEFRAVGAEWGMPDPDGCCDGPMPVQKSTLQKVIKDNYSHFWTEQVFRITVGNRSIAALRTWIDEDVPYVVV